MPHELSPTSDANPCRGDRRHVYAAMSGPPDLGRGLSRLTTRPGPSQQSPDDPQAFARAQGRGAAFLALVAGYVDAYAFVRYQLYVSFMSGNTTQTGSGAGQAKLTEAGHSLFPIPFFAIGVFIGTLQGRSGLRHSRRQTLGVVAGLLAVGLGVEIGGQLPGWGTIAILSLAMGIMGTTISRVGEQAVSVSYVTGSLSNLMTHLALAARGEPLPRSQGAWDTHQWRAALLATVWGGFFVGAVLCGALTARFGAWTLVLPSLALLAFAASPRATTPSD